MGTISLLSIIDAGPALNFFAINQERLLTSIAKNLCAPEVVKDEVSKKSRRDHRFQNAESVMSKLTDFNHLTILSDDYTVELEAVITRMTGTPFHERIRHAEHLGETMAIAHAVVQSTEGKTVLLLIDDGDGQRIAKTEISRLNRLRMQEHPVGQILLLNTERVLCLAAGSAFIPDKPSMRKLYARLRKLDDGLMPIEHTRILSEEFWITD